MSDNYLTSTVRGVIPAINVEPYPDWSISPLEVFKSKPFGVWRNFEYIFFWCNFLTRCNSGSNIPSADSCRASLRTHLNNLYGGDIAHQTAPFTKLCHKNFNLLFSLNFLLVSRDHDVISTLHKIKHQVTTDCSLKTWHQASMAFLKERIPVTHREYNFAARDFLTFHLSLSNFKIKILVYLF